MSYMELKLTREKPVIRKKNSYFLVLGLSGYLNAKDYLSKKSSCQIE